MAVTTYPFGGGAAAVPGYGDRWAIRFSGTWVATDTFTVSVASTVGPLTLGVGNLAALNPTVCFTYKNRVYLGLGSQFNFSDNLDPEGWEVQNPGAGYISYISQFGGQDTVAAFSQLQGRLVVAARRSVQIWTVDADPNQFALMQTLDNVGTRWPLSLQNLGDFDVLMLDDTGIRSLRSLQITQNAVVDDLGSPIDLTIRNALKNNGTNPICSIVEPQSKTFWLYLGGVIYVYCRHPSAKISAWTTFEPRDSTNQTFVAEKFVVYNGQVFARTTAKTLITYGGSTNAIYDAYSQVVFQTPWLDNKRSDLRKLWTAFEAVIAGQWTLEFGANPVSGGLTPFGTFGSAAAPSSRVDSTYDTGRKPISLRGTHISMKATSANVSTSTPAVFSAFTVHYNEAGIA